MMKKNILYRWFGLGSIPRKWLPLLQDEGIVVSDEGIAGWFIARKVKGPGKRYLGRMEGFSGCLVITGKRVLCFTYWRRQINIAVDDPKITHMRFEAPDDRTLSISFESSLFRDGWEGVIEFRFRTEKAGQFRDALKSLGALEGSATTA